VATEPRTQVTPEELLRMPSGTVRREVVEGELREMNPAGADHGRIAVRIGRLIDQYADEHGGYAFGAETGFTLSVEPHTTRAPDAAYVTAERAARAGRTPGFWSGAPDLAAEVVSPSDSYNETHEKALQWLAHGALVVLVVDPASGHVTRYRSAADITVFAGDERIDCGPAMPAFAPTPAQLIPML
jgi:Uma2 family endonuclease